MVDFGHYIERRLLAHEIGLLNVCSASVVRTWQNGKPALIVAHS